MSRRWVLLLAMAVGLGGAVFPWLDEPEPDAVAASSTTDDAFEEAPRQPAADEPPTDPAPAPAPSENGCDHDALPAQGTELTYDLRREGQGASRVTMRREPRHDAGKTAWSVTFDLDAPPPGADPRLETKIELPCDPGRWGEVPWLRLPEPGGVQIAGEAWKWPAHFEEGQDFGGPFTVTVTPYRESLVIRGRRSHRVMGMEEITVPAGTFRAWRLEVTEVYEAPDAIDPIHGTYWVAPRVGLVRAIHDRGMDQTLVRVSTNG